MASSCAYNFKLTIVITLLFSFILPSLAANVEIQDTQNCLSQIGVSSCHNNHEALKLKVIAIISILVASMIGVCLPMFTRGVHALRPDKDLFFVIKAFSSGVVLATGYMHVLPDSFDNLTSICLPRNPWRKFPFTTFVAMISALFTLMVDSYAMSIHKKKSHSLMSFPDGAIVETLENGSDQVLEKNGEIRRHDHNGDHESGKDKTQLLRSRVIAQILEMGIVVHSVVIGLAMGASENQCIIRSLIAALCFHQLFEGMGLGACILQAKYEAKMKYIMVFFFSVTTPFGIVLGIGLSKVYSSTSPKALIVVGILNACSAGLLNYMALVDLLAADFLGPKLQENMKLQTYAYVAVFLGAGGMSLMAKWA